jgi:hypothetical protein
MYFPVFLAIRIFMWLNSFQWNVSGSEPGLDAENENSYCHSWMFPLLLPGWTQHHDKSETVS